MIKTVRKDWSSCHVKYVDKQYKPTSENIIKADVILNAWLSYCRESRIYRILEFFKSN